MSAAGTEPLKQPEASPAAPTQRSWARIGLYLLAVVAVIGAVLYVVQVYRTRHPVEAAPITGDPDLIRSAQPLTASAQETFDQAIGMVQQKRWREAIPLLGSVAKFADDPALRAKSVLLAGTVMGLNEEESGQLPLIFGYFLHQFPEQPGTDIARYHLALLDLKQERLGEAESLLTAVLRDTPDSPLAPSAAYLAAETAKLIADRDMRVNQRVGHALAQSLPDAPGPMVLLGLTIAATIGHVYLAHREKLRRGTPLTVIEVLFVLMLTGYTTFLNQRKQILAIQPLAKAAAQQQVIPSR
jgi:hypothetical protein